MIPLELNNSAMCSFVSYTAESEKLKEYRPLSNQATRLQKLTAIMTGGIIWNIHLKIDAKYKRCRSQEKFKMNISRSQASALLMYLQLFPCNDELLSHDLINQIDPKL